MQSKNKEATAKPTALVTSFRTVPKKQNIEKQLKINTIDIMLFGVISLYCLEMKKKGENAYSAFNKKSYVSLLMETKRDGSKS